MTVAEVLRAAAARVRKGWCQGVGSDSRGGVCALVALSRAGAEDYDAPAKRYLRTFLREKFIGLVWNDAPGMTAEKVATAMEDAAFQWEVEHGLHTVEGVEVAEPVLVPMAVRRQS